MSRTLYDILGVKKNATKDQIKDAYKDKAKKAHPDKPTGSTEQMQELVVAYSILGDEKKRDRYDNTGETSETPFDQKFAGFVNNIFLQIIEMVGDGVEHVDMIEEFIEQVDNNSKKICELKEISNKKLRRLEKVISRLSSKTENKIGDILQHNVQQFKKEIRIADDDLQFLSDCKEVISHHSYKFEAPEPTQPDANDEIYRILTGGGSFNTFR